MRKGLRVKEGFMALLVVAGCSTTPPKDPTTYNRIKDEMKGATEDRAAREQQQRSVMQSLLPPIAPELPTTQPGAGEPRFDVTIANASVSEVFNAIVTDTRYSIIVHPDVKGTVTLSLKKVTAPEVFRTICDIRQFDCRIEGSRMIVQPATLQTRMFKVDFLNSERKGTSDVRVSSNAIAPTTGTSTPGAAPTVAPGGAPGTTGSAPSLTSTRIGTTSTNNFWTELRATLAVLIGCAVTKDDEVKCDGEQKDHRVVVSPQSGTVLVRAMPDQLRAISEYLRVSQNALERQVLIEAKILEVSLRDGFEAGVNWAGFFSQGGDTAGVGMLTPGTRLGATGTGTILDTGVAGGNRLIAGSGTALDSRNNLTGAALSTLGGRVLEAGASAAAGIFGIAVQGKNFSALLTFLDSQGVVHTLSSPRVATMNNQKAVLKVGTDALFVTKISSGQSSGTTSLSNQTTTQAPTFDTQSFFSGIALDVTPRINEDGTIVLHIRPSVSSVSQNLSTFNLGTLGTFVIPLVSNDISEADTVIRAQDGQIVALGGLMRHAQKEDRSQVPILGDAPFIGAAFRNTKQGSEKRELVVLLKVTVIKSDANWAQNILESRERIQGLDRGYSWTTKSEVFGIDEKYEPAKH